MSRRIKDIAALIFIYACTAVTIGSLLMLLIYILANGLPYISWEFLTTPFQPGRGLYGIAPMIASTLLLISLTILFAAPIGIFAAIYLHEYATPGRLLSAIRFAINCLTGIPSILYGLFGFTFFVVQLKMGYSLLAGALTLMIMVLPVIIRTTEESLSAVPVSYREASLALGVSKLWTTMRVVLPSAIAGIATSVVLAIGRIVGETAAVYYTFGLAKDLPHIEGLHDLLFASGRTLAVHLYLLSKEGTDQTQSFAAAAVLLIIVAIINWASNALARLMRRRSFGKEAGA